MSAQQTKSFLQSKVRTLAARAGRLAKLTPGVVGIRGPQRRYAPTPAHFEAANRRLAEIEQTTTRRLAYLKQRWRQAPPQETLVNLAMVEREVDRARRAFGLFFEVFSQRASGFAPALMAHDAIASDCYAAVKQSAPQVFKGPLLKPLTYMEHGYSPATMRRGVTLKRLLGERNPFPLIRIPWDRDNPWQAVFLHEVSHNLMADARVWDENKKAVMKRLIQMMGDAFVVSTYSRWHKEIWADVAAILLGGPAAAWGMMDFLAHPAPRTMTYQPGGAHPTGYLRVLILAEMLQRLGFEAEAGRMRRVWRGLFKPARGHRLPKRLLQSSNRAIPQVVDEIAFQTRRNLGQRALADIIKFDHGDERLIKRAAAYLARGVVPVDVPPRFLVSASRYALNMGAPLKPLSDLVIKHLSGTAIRGRLSPVIPMAAAA